MQSSSTVHGLSPAEDLFRRLDYRKIELRVGQKAFVQYVNDNPAQTVFNGVMPTGYGKSKTAECICDVLKQQGRATRFLFIVPTDTQREQYAIGVGLDVMNMGLNLRLMKQRSSEGVEYEVPIVIDHSASVHRAHMKNKCDVYITTVQSVTSNEGFYADLMSSGVWCVFADEYQKYNIDESARWGKAIESLNFSVLFGLTATPVRTDSKATIFANKKPDVLVTFTEAYDEKAIRGVVAHIEHYFVDVKNDDGEVDRITTENIDSYDISKELRYTTKYFASIINSAYSCLTTKNLTHPGQHQMLVFAMSVSHAKSVSDTMNAVYGNGFSDWVGVGPDGRSSAENKKILSDYKENRLPALVQVDIAGEGFDNPR